MSYAINSLVGKSLGENLPNRAKRYSYSSGFCSLLISTLIMTILIILREEIPLLYTKDESVIDTVSGVMPVFGFTILVDSFQAVLIGAIKGCGLQAYGTVLTIFSFWGVMLPSCYVLVFIVKVGLIGIWIGTSLGLLTASILFVILGLRIDWVELAQTVADSVMKETQKLIS